MSDRIRRTEPDRAASRTPWWRRDEGSAVVEFPLVSILVMIVAVAAIQTAVVLHTHNTVLDAAVQGAHHAALLGNTPEDGAQRAEQLIRERLGSGFEANATATGSADGTITVDVRATMPLIALFGPSGSLHASGRAIDEETW